MAGKKMIIKQRLHASSILEVVISMVIIVLIFGLAMTIFANVTRSSLSTIQINAQVILRNQLIKAEQQADYVDKILDTAGLKVEEKFKPRFEGSNLLEVQLIAYDENGKQIAELQKVIVTKNE
jgi:hypothetical protein